MLKEILNDATEQDLKNFVSDFMAYLEISMPKLYNSLLLELHKNVYGSHFSLALLNQAINELEDTKGTKGAKWSLEETNKFIKDLDLKYNEYDFNYVLNMMYYDYSELLNNDLNSYIKLACLFLDDVDAPNGKALRYYLAMRKCIIY